ncbi:hypothetical protein P3S68_022615 [Capsicum galapagoense]
MPKGSMENHLFRKSTTVEPLSWDLQLKIAIGATQGLTFLHTSEKKVIHKDFKASNILLGGDNSLHVVWSNHAGHRRLIRNNAGDQI